MLKRNLASIALATALGTSGAIAASVEDVETSFYPYKDAVPQAEGLSPGMTINAGNVEQFKDVLDLAIRPYSEILVTRSETSPINLRG